MYSLAQQTIPAEFNGKWKIATASDCSLFAIIKPNEYTPDSDWGMSKVKNVQQMPDNSLEIEGIESYPDGGKVFKASNKINLKLEKDHLQISGNYHEADFNENYIKCTKEDDDREAEASRARDEKDDAPKDRWVVFSNNDRNIMSFDSESISKGSIWIRAIAKSKKSYIKGARTTLSNIEFLCSMRSGGVTKTIGFSENGNKIFSYSYSGAITDRIEPQSIIEQFYRVACKDRY